MSALTQPDEQVRAPGERLLRLKGVGKVFSDGTVAIGDVSLSLRRGEFLTVLGPSGCGKSTVLRMIAGLGEPSRGSIQWRNSAAGPERRLSYVFQEPTLMPWARVTGNVRLPLKVQRLSKAESDRRVGEALAMVGLEGFADRFPRQLSLLRLWRSQGLTVIFVTHSVYESVYLSSRVAIMTARPGRIFAELDIKIPYPRDESLRTSPGYNDHCRLVSQRLHEAMDAGPADGR